MKTAPPSQKPTVPHTLIVTWNSGQETLNMDEIEEALKAYTPGATVKTTEYRVEEHRDIVYEPVLEKTTKGFSLTYKDKGNWVDDGGSLREADGELGMASYQQEEENGKPKWTCTWFHADNPKKGYNFPCESSNATRDHKEVKVKVRDAKFRDRIFGTNPKCLVTGETDQKVLEAAHIFEVQNDGNDRWENGIVLRVDLHRLFDKHILTVNAEGKFAMEPVPKSYEYLFKKDKLTWKKHPVINSAVLNRYAENIDKRNKKRQIKKPKG
jgi:hypothetical protein